MFRSASLFIGTSFTLAIFTIFVTSNVDSIVGIPHKIYSMRRILIHIKSRSLCWMCPSAPRVCSESGGKKPVLSLSLDLITPTGNNGMWSFICLLTSNSMAVSLNPWRDKESPSVYLLQIVHDHVISQGHDGFPSNSFWTVYRPKNIGHFGHMGSHVTVHNNKCWLISRSNCLKNSAPLSTQHHSKCVLVI